MGIVGFVFGRWMSGVFLWSRSPESVARCVTKYGLTLFKPQGYGRFSSARRVGAKRFMSMSTADGQQCVVYVTAPNDTVAQSIASALVESRLAACVNMIPSIKSTYLWQGKIETDQEVLLMIKTRKEAVPKLTERVVGLHPYDCPEVIALPIVGGFQGYLQWIDESTSQPAPPNE